MTATRASAKSRAEREHALAVREEVVARRERALGLQAAASPAAPPRTPTRADTARLMDQMREANERLIVAAVHARNLSDAADTEAARARAEVHFLLDQLHYANEQIADGAAHAHMVAAEARVHEESYRRLSRRLLVVQDEERRQLALDLHDPVGQRLAVLAMHLDIIGQKAEALDAGSRLALAESRSLVDQCAREVRTCAYLLYPPMLDEMGLPSAVRWYVEGFTKRSGIPVTTELTDIGRLATPVETALFRIVQESLTNVHRHASASTVTIRLTVTEGAVALTIRDREHGRDDRRAPASGQREQAPGVGVQGMRERVRQLGGTFNIEFTDTGTTVSVHVPLKTEAT